MTTKKTQIVTKLKNTNCDQTQILKLWQTSIVTVVTVVTVVAVVTVLSGVTVVTVVTVVSTNPFCQSPDFKKSNWSNKKSGEAL